MAVGSSSGLKGIAALTVGALILVVVPALWIWWSLSAASEAAEAIRVRTETLDAMRKHVAALADVPGRTEDGAADAGASPYLPGETAAIAGAALQRIVADTVEGAGGRMTESELTPVDPSTDDEAQVVLRASFETDINGLQTILYRLETGVPLLLLRSLAVQTGDIVGESNSEQPTLRVVMLVAGRKEA